MAHLSANLSSNLNLILTGSSFNQVGKPRLPYNQRGLRHVYFRIEDPYTNKIRNISWTLLWRPIIDTFMDFASKSWTLLWAKSFHWPFSNQSKGRVNTVVVPFHKYWVLKIIFFHMFGFPFYKYWVLKIIFFHIFGFFW